MTKLYDNILAAPKLQKIVINTGLGEALTNEKIIDTMAGQIALITGQKPAVTVAKHDISSYKLRKGEKIGLKVTLHGKRMYDFIEKLISVVIPRFRDFRGLDVNKGFDGRGSFTLGIPEQLVFPEIEYNQVDKVRGLEITIVTNGKTREETKKFLLTLGMPFKK